MDEDCRCSDECGKKLSNLEKAKRLLNKIPFTSMGTVNITSNIPSAVLTKRAAATAAKRKGALDETGLIFTSCRHQVAQKGINMYQVELFAYHHYLHTKDILDRNASFIFQDIACKYRPWAERVDPSNASKVTFALNLMHGTGTTAHAR